MSKEMKRSREVIVALINELPEPQKTILALYYDEELLIDEIAHVMDLPVSQVTLALATAISNVFTCKNLIQSEGMAVH